MRMVIPVGVWALHFAAIYGFTGLACARGWASAVPWSVGGATLLAAAACTLILMKHLSREFTHWMTAALAAVAVVAIVFEGLPVLMVPACGLR